jgi:hypothetical protein
MNTPVDPTKHVFGAIGGEIMQIMIALSALNKFENPEVKDIKKRLSWFSTEEGLYNFF